MNFDEAARSSWRDVWANKVRSALSFAAISVGVASLLYTVAQTRGMQLELKKNLALAGPGRITITRARNYVSKGLSSGLTMDDVEAIRAEVPGLYMVDAKASNWVGFVISGRARNDEVPYVDVRGITEEWRKRDWVYKLHGRFLNSRDVKNASRVCVLLKPGGWLHKPFWAKYWDEPDRIGDVLRRRNMIGQAVRLKDDLFTVVGIIDLPARDLDPRWESWGDPNVLVPITTLERSLVWKPTASRPVDEIHVDTGDERTVTRLHRVIEELLLRRHRGEKDFEMSDLRDEIAGESENMKQYIVTSLILGVVAILAGGIGIMNVTLATIFSRIKEIGVRRALGAGRGDILAQFLCEAGVLGLAGGAAGIVLGMGGVHLLASWGGERRIADVTWYHCVIGVVSGGVISALFALYPAYQASGLDPVEALRSE